MLNRVNIIDPQGLTHTVAFSERGVEGYENLAHGFDRSVRREIIQNVLAAAQLKLPLPHGYTYAA